METKAVGWFAEKAKSFEAFALLAEKLAKEVPSLRFSIVQYENDLVSLRGQVRGKEVELAEIEKQIKERRALADQSTRAIHDQLNRRHLELVERESKIRIMEKATKENLDKSNNLLAAAESKAGPRHKVEVEA